MGLQNNKLNKTESGFTIVELLIVIVVIGILAAITIVAFNGIQNRGNTAAAQAAASALTKKAEAYNADKGQYPVSTANFNAVNESSLTGANITLGNNTTVTASTGKTTVRYEYCIDGATAPTTASTATGARVTYFEYPSTLPASASAQYKLGTASGTQTMTCAIAS